MTLILVIGLDGNWDAKFSHGPVCFTKPGADYDFIFSIKLCFCQNGTQPNIAVIFWRKGMGVAYFDKQAYEYDVILF